MSSVISSTAKIKASTSAFYVVTGQKAPLTLVVSGGDICNVCQGPRAKFKFNHCCLHCSFINTNKAHKGDLVIKYRDTKTLKKEEKTSLRTRWLEMGKWDIAF